ncbi:manganese efflux pump MntP [Malaciobacter mytili LMG 24559]|uniref:Putative manganese efflux pump MntP n=1 Tax=Malaciobacter mytili LMG 24559 TaxID=1032238 RepID=A0AAX2AGC6_9BACT|nr:manganese efflux pump MntP family protein [Malaciobacter mytili]AXH14016.1 manganese efflux pump MntP [Malaciobacter mytili LMG 24559]RXK15078.1 manganese efflux pump MntP [Malaciobacter mytili LMG 24559]
MLEVFILAVALSMDAFAVSIGLGIKNSKNLKTLAFKAGVYFGFFQALMPFIGYIGGVGLKDIIKDFDYWIAFFILQIIGSKMIYEAFYENIEKQIKVISNKVLFTLAIATSIDALATGFTLHLFSLNIYISLLLIGIITFIFSFLGVFIGSKGNAKYEKKAEIFGGVILIVIGFKILFKNITIF